MYFAKTLAACVALTVFATSTIAAPTKASAKAPATGAVPVAKASGPLVAGTGIFSKVKATKATWDKVSQLCASGKKAKRDFDGDFDLEARTDRQTPILPPGYTEVMMGKSGSYSATMPIGLWTKGLVTCLGVVVVGKAPAANPSAHNRFLLHTTSSRVQLGWDEFEETLGAQNLEDMEGWISAPDLINDLHPGFANDVQVQRLVDMMIEATEAKLRAIIGKKPEMVTHTMDPPSTMQVSGDGKVYVNGKTPVKRAAEHGSH